MRLKTALVVSGGGLQGLALVKALRAVPDVRALVADCNANHVTGYLAQASFRAPLLAQEDVFEDFLRSLCHDEQVDAVFPATNFELQTLLRLKPALQVAGTQVWVSAAPVLALAHSKRAFYRWLHMHDLAALPHFDSPAAGGAQTPLIGKPDNGWGGRNLVRLHTPQQVQAHLCESTPGPKTDWVWQPLLLNFDELSVDFAIHDEGQISELHMRRRLVTQGGFAVLCEPVDPTEEFAPAQALALATAERLAALGARGLLNLQLLVHEGRFWVSDFNARVGTSMPLTLATGYNPVAFLMGRAPATAAAADRSRPEPSARQHSFRMLQERWVKRPHLGAVRGLVFDLDDTLFDQKDWIVRKLRLLWQEEQDVLPAQMDFLRAALQILEEGERAKLLDKLCAALGLQADVATRLISTYRHLRPTACHVYSDVLPTLAQLRRSGYRLGLLSDNPAASQRQKLHVAGLETLFDAVVLTGDLGRPKPDTAAFEAVAQAMQLPAQALVMVGDNPFRDSDGALAAGFAHAFHIRRDGAFFNFQLGEVGAAAELAQELFGRDRITPLQDLNELNWYLQGGAA